MQIINIMYLKIINIMYLKLLYVLIPVACFLNSCSNSRIDGTFFDYTQNLYAEKILVNEIYSPDGVTKSGNNFIISSSQSDKTIFIYDTPSLTFKSSTGIKGGGPDDIQTFPMFCHTLDDKYLYVRGYSHFSIRKIKIEPDGSFKFIDEYELERSNEYNFMNIVQDSILLYYDNNNLSINKYDLKNKKKIKSIALKKEDHNETYYYSNRGAIAANESFLMFSYLFKKQINIYDIENFKLIKTINDGKKYPGITVYDQEITYHYLNTYAGKKYFYAMYAGQIIYNNRQIKNDYSNQFLEVYDYEGNPIIKYAFDILPFQFVVDEDNGYIYGYNSNYEDYLLRYKL